MAATAAPPYEIKKTHDMGAVFLSSAHRRRLLAIALLSTAVLVAVSGTAVKMGRGGVLAVAASLRSVGTSRAG